MAAFGMAGEKGEGRNCRVTRSARSPTGLARSPLLRRSSFLVCRAVLRKL
jgi:hypothetical protein